MRKAIKKRGLLVPAYEFGKKSVVEQHMIAEGRICLLPDGKYEVYSLEAKNGSGEIASTGDFFKVDGHGFPYPIARAFFLDNHRCVGNDLYEQRSIPFEAWSIDDGVCPEISYLMEHKGLVINNADPEKFFSVPLWGTVESAARDAVIVFYSLERDTHGQITDATFNFVERSEFDRTYEWVQ